MRPDLAKLRCRTPVRVRIAQYYPVGDIAPLRFKAQSEAFVERGFLEQARVFDVVPEPSRRGVPGRCVSELQRTRIGPRGAIEVTVFVGVESVLELRLCYGCRVTVRTFGGIEQQPSQIVIHADRQGATAIVTENAINRPALQQLPGGASHTTAERQLIGSRVDKRVRHIVVRPRPFARLRVDGILNSPSATLPTVGAVVVQR